MADQKIALVTGANKGIGFEIARGLAAEGLTVLIGARNAALGQAAAEKLRAEGGDVRFQQIDVTNEASIAAAAKQIAADFGKLDVLVNNAGISREGKPPSETDLGAMRETYETNVFGAVAVITAMLPLLKKAPAARIVNMSSGLGSLAQLTDPNHPVYRMLLLAYNSSKAALNAVTVQFANELRDTPIKVNVANPGLCSTDLTGNRGGRTAAQGAIAPLRLALLPADGPTAGFFSETGPTPW